MSEFFDKNLLQNVVVSLSVMGLSIWLGSGGYGSQAEGKGWKIVIVISWAMIIGGFYLFANNLSRGGLQNMYVGMGISSFFLGVILRYIGKFFVWWQG